LPTLMVMVEVPAPVMEVGLKVTVFELPCPDADKEMAESKPPVTEVVIFTVPELPRATLRDVGEALIEKLAAVPVTVSVTVVVSFVEPEVPVTVIV